MAWRLATGGTQPHRATVLALVGRGLQAGGEYHGEPAAVCGPVRQPVLHVRQRGTVPDSGCPACSILSGWSKYSQTKIRRELHGLRMLPQVTMSTPDRDDADW